MENQAITEHQCSFHSQSLAGELDHVKTVKEAAFSFPTFACLGNNASLPHMQVNQ